MKKPVKKAVTPPASSRPVATPACQTCRYWHVSATHVGGLCKRFPPTPLVGAGYIQPRTKPEDTCGEHKAKV